MIKYQIFFYSYLYNNLFKNSLNIFLRLENPLDI